MEKRADYAISREVVRDYQARFLEGIVSRDKFKDYITIPQIQKLLGCTYDMVKRQILWIFNVPSHMVGNTRIVRKEDLREFLQSPNGEVWVRERFCRGKISRETLDRINTFKGTGKC